MRGEKSPLEKKNNKETNMLTFTTKISGVRCDGWEHIDPETELKLECGSLLKIANLTSRKAMEFVFKHYELRQFIPPNEAKYVATFLDLDDQVKIAIMENHPEEEEELQKQFGENWAEYYIRFGH